MPGPSVVPAVPAGIATLVPAANVVIANATATAGAVCNATLPASAGLTNYIVGFVVTSLVPAGASALNGNVTVSNLTANQGSNGTLSFLYIESTIFGGQLVVNFPMPIPANGANVAITVSLPVISSGSASAVTAYGFVQ